MQADSPRTTACVYVCARPRRLLAHPAHAAREAGSRHPPPPLRCAAAGTNPLSSLLSLCLGAVGCRCWRPPDSLDLCSRAPASAAVPAVSPDRVCRSGPSGAHDRRARTTPVALRSRQARRPHAPRLRKERKMSENKTITTAGCTGCWLFVVAAGVSAGA